MLLLKTIFRGPTDHSDARIRVKANHHDGTALLRWDPALSASENHENAANYWLSLHTDKDHTPAKYCGENFDGTGSIFRTRHVGHQRSWHLR